MIWQCWFMYDLSYSLNCFKGCFISVPFGSAGRGLPGVPLPAPGPRTSGAPRGGGGSGAGISGALSGRGGSGWSRHCGPPSPAIGPLRGLELHRLPVEQTFFAAAWHWRSRFHMGDYSGALYGDTGSSDYSSCGLRGV